MRLNFIAITSVFLPILCSLVRAAPGPIEVSEVDTTSLDEINRPIIHSTDIQPVDDRPTIINSENSIDDTVATRPKTNATNSIDDTTSSSSPKPKINATEIIDDSKPTIEEDTGGVKINQEPAPTTQDLPILAQLFTGSPGPKECRGSVLATINLPKPYTQHLQPVCYNLGRTSECAVFMANQGDGCEATLFYDKDCNPPLTTLAVFMQEYRAVGGLWKSLSVRCGVVGVVPPPLNLPGIGG